MISHRYRCIFIHNRKAAGTSVRASFGLESSDPDWNRYNNGVKSWDWYFRPDYLVFTIVRNPFDRLVSAWKYLGVTRNRSLSEVLRDPPRRGLAYRHLTRSQSAILVDFRNRLVADEIVRVENLQEGCDRVCDRLGKPRAILPHKNSTSRQSDYRTYFDHETQRRAEALFADDLERFGYTF
jgi:hypothetical protein